jgi:hypothetical protein
VRLAGTSRRDAIWELCTQYRAGSENLRFLPDGPVARHGIRFAALMIRDS